MASRIQGSAGASAPGNATSATRRSQLREAFELGAFAIDEHRPMRVIVIGAGYSGIIAGIRIPQRLRNIEFVIYEKLSGVGGTWFSNKFPGIACDVPSHCYQLSFEPNPHWSAFYAPGSEILAYLNGVVDKYKLTRYIKLNHELTSAVWDPEAGKWKLTLSSPQGVIQDAGDVVIDCTGILSRWQWPDIEGLFEFGGQVVHSAEWNLSQEEGKEAWEGKRVAVIGLGSTAIQIVPSVQKKAAKVANFVRGKTWICTPFASSEVQVRNPGGDNHYFTDAEFREFDDPEYYAKFRRKIEGEINGGHGASLLGHPMQLAAEETIKEVTLQKLKKPGIAEHLIPEFPVSCRRLTPGTGFLDALNQDNVEFVTNTIKRVTPNGIETRDGKHRDFDIIVCATGFDTTWKLPYPVIGRDGVRLEDKWSECPVTYLTVATDSFPNWFFTLGPNSGLGGGSLIIWLETKIKYITSVIAKLQRERIKSIEAKEEAVKEFDEYLEHYFPRTVYSEKCPSWYKRGQEEGRVTAIWPGSGLHALRTLARPRWEDFNYELLGDQQNRFHWLGNGWTVNERDECGDRAWYMDEIDYPPVPE